MIELMLLGFISLLLTVGQGPITNICISKEVGATWHPCNKKQEAKLDKYAKSNYDGANERRRLLWDADGPARRILAGGGGDDKCAAKVGLNNFFFFFSTLKTKFWILLYIWKWKFTFSFAWMEKFAMELMIRMTDLFTWTLDTQNICRGKCHLYQRMEFINCTFSSLSWQFSMSSIVYWPMPWVESRYWIPFLFLPSIFYFVFNLCFHVIILYFFRIIPSFLYNVFEGSFIFVVSDE